MAKIPTKAAPKKPTGYGQVLIDGEQTFWSADEAKAKQEFEAAIESSIFESNAPSVTVEYRTATDFVRVIKQQGKR